MKKYLYVHVKLYEFEDEWSLRYLSDEDIYKEGDYVWVQSEDVELPMIVTKSVWYNEDEVPWPLNKMKKIIRKSSREEYLKHNEWSILNYILSRLDKNSKLPEDFTLNNYRHDNEVKFVDGAIDGIYFFHSEQEENKELKNKICDFIEKNKEEKPDADKIINLVKKCDTLLKNDYIRSCIDSICKYAYDNMEEIGPEYLYNLAHTMIYRSKNPETVKLGLGLISIFKIEEIDKELYYVFNKMVLCEEFTELIAVCIFPHYKDENKLKFKAAKQIHGWGRIFLIFNMNYDSDEIKQWLLNDGYENYIDESYTSTYILSVLDTKKIIKDSKNDIEKFLNISNIINISIIDGPGAPISILDNYKEIFDTYLSIKDYHKDDYMFYTTVKNMYVFEEEKYKDAYNILESDDCYKTVKECMINGDRYSAYNVIDICDLSKKHDYESIVLERFEKNPIENGFCMYYLLRNNNTKDKIIKQLNEGEYLVDGLEINETNYIEFLDELKNYPLVGLPFIYEAFNIGNDNIKNKAIWIINYWKENNAKIPKDLKKYIWKDE